VVFLKQEKKDDVTEHTRTHHILKFSAEDRRRRILRSRRWRWGLVGWEGPYNTVIHREHEHYIFTLAFLYLILYSIQQMID
jgi:hypothetical protein